jgi:AmmeMemoRadiSam system protein A
MVPLYFINKYLLDYNLVVVGLSGISLEDNFEMGKIIYEAVRNLDRNVVYVASGDLSHKLQEYGPYGFVPEGPIYDKRIIDVMSHARFNELLDFDSDFLDTAAECGHRSFIMMSGFLNNTNVTPKFYSHEDITGVGYGICSYYPINPYVELAKNTIEAYIKNKKVIEIPSDIPKELVEEKRAVFVSIHKKGYLRGCIGTILPMTKCVAQEIINNAISASTNDPRFNPITPDELDDLEINVDVLTIPEDIEDESMLDPKKYGVIVTSGLKRGVLLPDLEGVDTVEEQVSIAKDKANIKENEKIELQRFEVIRHK